MLKSSFYNQLRYFALTIDICHNTTGMCYLHNNPNPKEFPLRCFVLRLCPKLFPFFISSCYKAIIELYYFFVSCSPSMIRLMYILIPFLPSSYPNVPYIHKQFSLKIHKIQCSAFLSTLLENSVNLIKLIL